MKKRILEKVTLMFDYLIKCPSLKKRKEVKTSHCFIVLFILFISEFHGGGSHYSTTTTEEEETSQRVSLPKKFTAQNFVIFFTFPLTICDLETN